MENKTNLKILIALILNIIGFFGTIFTPFVGIVFFGGAIGLTFKRETKEAQHLLLASIVGLICVIILIITTLVNL